MRYIILLTLLMALSIPGMAKNNLAEEVLSAASEAKEIGEECIDHEVAPQLAGELAPVMRLLLEAGAYSEVNWSDGALVLSVCWDEAHKHKQRRIYSVAERVVDNMIEASSQCGGDYYLVNVIDTLTLTGESVWVCGRAQRALAIRKARRGDLGGWDAMNMTSCIIRAVEKRGYSLEEDPLKVPDLGNRIVKVYRLTKGKAPKKGGV